MKVLQQFAVLLAVVIFGQSVKANTGGIEPDINSTEGAVVHGYVINAVTRKPVTGVTVSIASNKVQPGKEVQSDATGHFRISRLPAGEVSLIFEKKGFRLFKRDMPPLRDGMTARIAVEVQPVSEVSGGNEVWHPFFKFLD